MNLHRKPTAIYIGLLIYPCIPLTTKHTQAQGGSQWPVQIILKDFWQVLDKIYDNDNEV
jgi:hypothetical protein